MSSKKREINLIPAILIIVGVIVLVVIGSLYAFNSEPETIQGQADVTEYRVSSKVPARIAQIRVHEGDYVHKGEIHWPSYQLPRYKPNSTRRKAWLRLPKRKT